MSSLLACSSLCQSLSGLHRLAGRERRDFHTLIPPRMPIKLLFASGPKYEMQSLKVLVVLSIHIHFSGSVKSWGETIYESYTVQTVRWCCFVLFQIGFLLMLRTYFLSPFFTPRRNQPVSVSSPSIWLVPHIAVQMQCNCDAYHVKLNKE